jgi:hypothetical protein
MHIKIIGIFSDFVILSLPSSVVVNFPLLVDSEGRLRAYMTLELSTSHIRNFLYMIYWHEQIDYSRCHVRTISIRTCRFIPNCYMHIHIYIYVSVYSVPFRLSFSVRSFLRSSFYCLSIICLSLLFIVNRFWHSFIIGSNQRLHENKLGEHVYDVDNLSEVFFSDIHFTSLITNDTRWNLSTSSV